MTNEVGWRKARNILCVRLDGAGDVLMTTPAMRALKDRSDERRITLLTSRAGAAAAALVPEIDETIVYEAPWMKSAEPRTSGPDQTVLERLRKGKFDAAVIFTVYSQSPLPAALYCYLADIPRRLAHCRENPYLLLTDWLPEQEPQSVLRHETQRQLDLVEAVGATIVDPRLSLRVPDEALFTARKTLAQAGIHTQRPWAVLHTGASAPSRRYPPEQFARVAKMLAGDGIQLAFTGDVNERALVDRIRTLAGVPSVSLAGKLGLPELAALIALAPVLVSNNTLPVHIAAAVQTPVVDLYALTNPQHTPWQVASHVLSHDVPCKYCYKSVCPEGHHNCLRLVTPLSVASAVRSLLSETRKSASTSVSHVNANS